MLFSDKSRVPIMFEKATFKRTKDGNRLARMRFAVKLEADVASHSPSEIRAAFEAVNDRETCMTSAQISMELEKIDMTFYAMPENQPPTQKLLLNLGDFAVIRDEGAIGARSEPHLFFSAEIGLDDRAALRHWIADNVFCRLFATFEEAQLELTDSRPEKPSGTTVSMGIKRNGKFEYTDPIPVEQFDQRLKAATRHMAKAGKKPKTKAATNGDPG